LEYRALGERGVGVGVGSHQDKIAVVEP